MSDIPSDKAPNLLGWMIMQGTAEIEVSEEEEAPDQSKSRSASSYLQALKDLNEFAHPRPSP